MTPTAPSQRDLRAYLKTLGIGSAIVIGAIIGLNVWVDPHGIYRGSDRGWNNHPRAGISSRISTAEKLRQQKFDTVFFGTSRVSALDEFSPHLAGRKTLNAPLDGSSFREVEAAIRFAVEYAEAKRIVILVDFFQFNVRPNRPLEFDRSLLNPNLSLLEYHSQNLLGLTATQDSLEILWKYVRGKPIWNSLDRGLANPTGAMPRKRFEETARHYLNSRTMYQKYRYSPDQLECFRRSIRLALARDVEVYVAISPVHAMQLETARAAGLWETQENWKRDLVKVVAEENQAVGGNAQLWDFTGYTSYTAEAVPEEKDETPLTYYRESSHFKPILGDILLARMLTSTAENPEFGVVLHPQNVEEHLQRIRDDYVVWRQGNVGNIQWLQKIARGYGHAPALEAAPVLTAERPAKPLR